MGQEEISLIMARAREERELEGLRAQNLVLRVMLETVRGGRHG